MIGYWRQKSTPSVPQPTKATALLWLMIAGPGKPRNSGLRVLKLLLKNGREVSSGAEGSRSSPPIFTTVPIRWVSQLASSVLGPFRAPAAGASPRQELAAANPAIVRASRARRLPKGEQVGEDEKVIPGHAVGRDRRVGVDESVVLHDPESGVIFRLDGVVSHILEGVAGDLEAVVRLAPAGSVFAAIAAERRADAVVGVEDVIPEMRTLPRTSRVMNRAPFNGLQKW